MSRLYDVYLSGPMSGHPEFNRPRFEAAARALELKGLKVLIPHDIPAIDHDGACPDSYATGEAHSNACHLRQDLIVMLRDCGHVVVLPGWEASVGARLEVSVAAACGMRVRFLGVHEVTVQFGPRPQEAT